MNDVMTIDQMQRLCYFDDENFEFVEVLPHSVDQLLIIYLW